MVIVALYARKLNWSSVLSISLTSGFLGLCLYEKNQFELKKEMLQKKNKDNYLAIYQRYFIENFTTSFSLKGNYDEGFGILYPYLENNDKIELEANRFFFQKLIKDFNTFMPFQILSTIFCGIPSSILMIAYYVSFYKFKKDFEKSFEEEKNIFNTGKFINKNQYFLINDLSGKGMILLGCFSIFRMIKKK